MDNVTVAEMRQKIYAKERIAVLHERKRLADSLDGISAAHPTNREGLLLSEMANHNLAMRKIVADTHKNIAFVNKSGSQPAVAAAPKPKKETAAKFFAKKAKKSVAKKKPAPKKPVKKAAKRKR